MRIRTGDVTAPAERALLRDYFDYRASAFPTPGGYTVAFPDPAAFEPPAGVFLVVDDDEGAPAGCAGIRMLPSPGAGTVRYEVKHVWLDPRTRGRGWATALMTELEARARGLGATELVLDTHDSLTGAARLYARLGFEPTEPYNDNPNATRWYRKAL
ncbi:MAG: GNAT family N-acetyltransferase [Herbiconiux sp.]|nr:GNAT family N-acetyltransferase [Herbiconiux sp.]